MDILKWNRSTFPAICFIIQHTNYDCMEVCTGRDCRNCIANTNNLNMQELEKANQLFIKVLEITE